MCMCVCVCVCVADNDRVRDLTLDFQSIIVNNYLTISMRPWYKGSNERCWKNFSSIGLALPMATLLTPHDGTDFFFSAWKWSMGRACVIRICNEIRDLHLCFTCDFRACWDCLRSGGRLCETKLRISICTCLRSRFPVLFLFSFSLSYASLALFIRLYVGSYLFFCPSYTFSLFLQVFPFLSLSLSLTLHLSVTLSFFLFSFLFYLWILKTPFEIKDIKNMCSSITSSSSSSSSSCCTSLTTPPYSLLLLEDPLDYISNRQRAAVCRFKLGVLSLFVHG